MTSFIYFLSHPFDHPFLGNTPPAEGESSSTKKDTFDSSFQELRQENNDNPASGNQVYD